MQHRDGLARHRAGTSDGALATFLFETQDCRNNQGWDRQILWLSHVPSELLRWPSVLLWQAMPNVNQKARECISYSTALAMKNQTILDQLAKVQKQMCWQLQQDHNSQQMQHQRKWPSATINPDHYCTAWNDRLSQLNQTDMMTEIEARGKTSQQRKQWSLPTGIGFRTVMLTSIASPCLTKSWRSGDTTTSPTWAQVWKCHRQEWCIVSRTGSNASESWSKKPSGTTFRSCVKRWSKRVKLRSLETSYYCNRIKHVLKDDFVCFCRRRFPQHESDWTNGRYLVRWLREEERQWRVWMCRHFAAQRGCQQECDLRGGHAGVGRHQRHAQRAHVVGNWRKQKQQSKPPILAFRGVKSLESGAMQVEGELCCRLWEDGISPGGNTPHWAKAQRVFPLALSTWKKECRSEY